MVCTACQQDNQPNAKFCSECGAPLARPCPSCGREQLSTAKFCDECGTSLTAAPPTGPTPVPAAARKRVTALFADLVGSTAFAERLDAEAVRASLAPYFDLLQSTIDDHAGSVVKFLGDGVFALFGIPEVAEDDALRAVAAGVDLQQRFRSFAEEIHDRHGVELGLRVGVNTGELVVGTDDVDLVGDVLNTAARLEAACEPGHILVGEDTWRVTRSNVRYEVLGDVRVKGKSEPVAAFQVVGPERVGADELTPFVGRSSELESLREVFGEAVGASAARLATVIGDPGVGKTRLAQELRGASEARSFDLRLERRGSTTFAPIADLLRELTGTGSVEDVDRLVDGHPEAGRLGPMLASFLGHGEPRTTEELFWAVRRLLELLAADKPVIVVVDDIQWAEPLFWDLLDHLVEWTAAPVLLLALARPELRELRPELTRPGRRVSASIALEGLDADTTLELAARLLGIDELPSDLAERLPESTEGNPLFVRELVQMLVDDGVLARDGDRWRLTIDADAIEVPPTILSLLASRVERLPGEERQVVELASVIGTEFDRGTLAAIAIGDVATRLDAVVDSLRRKDLIEPTGQWAGDHPVYRFHHVLIRDAAYRRLLKGHRAELHERVGRHVETTGIADDERDVIVAHHFEQVCRYRTELGAVDDRTRELAIEAAARLRSAAEQALGREDLASAGSAAIRALGVLDTDAGAERDELLVIGCEALLSSGDVTRGAPLVDELHRRSADARLAAWADCFRAQLWSLTAADRLTEAGELAADAADLLGELGDDAGVAKARLVRAGCLARLGRVGDCETELDLALGAARSAGDRRRTVAVLGAAPLAALWGPSPVARAGGRCLDVLRLLRITTASPTVEATSIRCQGMLEALRGRDDAARAKFETSRAIAHELGLRHALYETELFAGLAELLVGDAVAAEPHLRAAREGLGRLGIGADAGQAAALLARSLLLQGRVDEADELATAALDTAGQNLQTAIAARAVLAEVRATQGRHEDARELVDEALSIVAPTDVTLDHALTLLAAARVAIAAGDAAASTRHRQRAEDLLAAKGATLAFHEPDPTGGIADGPSPARASSPTPAPHRLWNHPLEMAQRSSELATAGDRDGFLACYAPDFVTVDHGASAESVGYVGRSDAASWADFALWIMTQDEGAIGAPIPIAVRGARHGLMRWTLHTPTADLERLVVVVSDGVVLQSADFYDPDQLVDALEALDRRWLLAEGLTPGDWFFDQWHLTRSTDAGAIMEILHDEFEYVVHRTIGSGGGGRPFFAELAAASESIFSAAMVPQVFRLSPNAIVLERMEYDPAGGGEMSHIMVIGVLDNRVRHYEVFDPADLRVALQRYGEIIGDVAEPQSLSNTAWQLSQRVDDAFARRDAQAMLDELAPDFVSVWREQLAGGRVDVPRETFVDVVLHVDGGAAVINRTTRLLAVRGDHLALTWNSTDHDGTVHVRYAVVECDDHYLTRIDWFDDDQLADARDELDRRYLLSQGFSADHWVVANWPGTYGTSAGELLPYLHPDVKFVEHRRFHHFGGGTDELLRSADAPYQGTAMVTQIFRVTERGALIDRVETEPGAPGESRMLMVLGFADQRITHLEVFEADDLEAALARYDELTSEATPAGVAPNNAYRLTAEFAQAVVSRDQAAMLNLLSDDFVWDGRRILRAAVTPDAHLGRADFVADMLTVAAEANLASALPTLVARRGDDLHLATVTVNMAAGDELVILVLGESDGSRLCRLTHFDETQAHEAHEELDRRYRLACGIDDHHWVATYWDTLRSFDADRYAQILPPDFQSFDHRAVALGLTGRDEFLTWLRSTPASSTWSVPVIHRLNGRAMVLENNEVWADGAGESRILAVIEFGDGVTPRMDCYDVDDLDAALARYDEITRTARRTLTNDAWESARRRQDAQSRQDRIGFGAMLDDQFVAEFHDLLTRAVGTTQFGKAGFVELILHPDLTSVGASTEMELLAIRGDDLCLRRVGMISPSGDLTERLVVDAVHDGRCIRMDIFDPDQLIDAQLELDLWYRRACGIEDNHWLAAAASSPYTTDFASLEWFLHPDFEYVEHRPLAWPSGDAAHLREFMATYGSVPELIIPIVHRLSEDGLVYERLETADDHAVTDVIMVCHFQDERLRRLVAYEPEDLDRALAEFDEFVARRSSRTLTNRAWEIAEEVQRVKVSGDRDRFASFFADDFVVTSHDSIMGQVTDGTYDKVRWLEAASDPLVFGPASTQDLELIAVRGDDHCLFRSTSTTGSGDLHERLNVLEVQDGRAVRMDVFPHDQLRAAQLELDRWHRRSCGLEDVRWMAEEGAVALYATDFASIEPFLHPDFEYIEHRPLSFFDGDAADLQQAFEVLPIESEVIVPVVHRLSEHGMVCERFDLYRNGWRSEQLHVSHFQDGRLRRLEGFTVDDLDRALAEFDALVARREAGERRMNAAWALAQNAMLAHRDGDRDRFASCLTDDFVGTAHDPIMASVDVDGTVFDRARFVEASFDPSLYGPGSTSEVELIAVRGDDYCLFRVRTTSTSGDVNERIHGLGVRDGLGVRWDSYRDDQLREAQIELDRRWLASLGFDEGDWVIQHWDLVYGIAFDEFDAVLHHDFEFVDHRPLHFPSGDASALSTTMSSLSHDVEVLLPQVHRISPAGGVFERIERAVGDVLGEDHMIILSHITNGALRRLESFTVDDLASALARYDELVAVARPPVPTLTNRAWEIAVAFAAAYSKGDRDGLNRLVDPGGEVESRGRLNAFGSVSGQGFLDFRLAVSPSAEEGPRDLEVVAVRGEHRCLVLVDRWLHGDLQRLPIVVETDDERVTRMVWFDDDQLIDAQIELDRGWLEALGYADRWWEPIRLVMYDPHPDAMFEHLAPDFEYVDHRPLMYPSGDAEVLRSTIDSSQHDVIFTIPHIHRISDSGAVIERIETAVSEIGQTHVVFVSQFVDQRVQRMEAFDITQLDQALARYNEFVDG